MKAKHEWKFDFFLLHDMKFFMVFTEKKSTISFFFFFIVYTAMSISDVMAYVTKLNMGVTTLACYALQRQKQKRSARILLLSKSTLLSNQENAYRDFIVFFLRKGDVTGVEKKK